MEINTIFIFLVVNILLYIILILIYGRKYTNLKRKLDNLIDKYTASRVSSIGYGTVGLDVMRSNIDYFLRNQSKNNLVALIIIRVPDMNNFNQNSAITPLGGMIIDETVKRIKSCIRSTDFAAVFNNTDFWVVLPEIKSREDVEERVKRLVFVFKDCLAVNGNEYDITPVIGVSLSSIGSKNVDTLISNAELALKKSEKEDINFSIVGEYNRLEDYRVSYKDILDALNTNNVVVYYQPQYDVEKGKIVSAEALVRLIHPKYGMIQPDSFIPIAEKSGLITELGYRVLEETCKVMRNTCFEDLSMSVNVSGYQLRQVDLVENIERIVTNQGVSPERITLEITETVAISDKDNAMSILVELRNFGFKLSIDDFGYGHSFLTYVNELPVSEIKIAKPFIDCIAEDESKLTLLKNMLSLVNSTSVSVVVEGVEYEEQLDIVKQLKVDKVQGYLVSKPLSYLDFKKFIEKENDIVKV